MKNCWLIKEALCVMLGRKYIFFSTRKCFRVFNFMTFGKIICINRFYILIKFTCAIFKNLNNFWWYNLIYTFIICANTFRKYYIQLKSRVAIKYIQKKYIQQIISLWRNKLLSLISILFYFKSFIINLCWVIQ